MTFHYVEYIRRVLWWAPHPGRGGSARPASAGGAARSFRVPASAAWGAWRTLWPLNCRINRSSSAIDECGGGMMCAMDQANTVIWATALGIGEPWPPD